jgi:PAS domain S-box-containing protein
MIVKGRSLAQTITLQFLIIVVPITAIFLYQAYTDLRQATAVQFHLQRAVLAQQALNNYKVFINATTDAVDTGYLSGKGVEALRQTRSSLQVLGNLHADVRSQPLLDTVGTLLNAAEKSPSVAELLPLRVSANRVDKLLNELVEDYEHLERENIEEIAKETKNQVLLAFITLTFVIGFVYFLIRRLTQPLYRAVALAESIAAGDFKEGKVIDTRQDIGGLLTSLAAMRENLRQAFSSLATNEKRLSNAQHIAGIGDWEFNLVTGSITRSDEVFRIIGRKPGELSDASVIPLEIVYPEDRRLVEDSFALAKERGENFDIDFRILLPGGNTRFVHVQSEMAHTDGDKPVAVAGIIQDIHERKSAEQQIQHLALHDELTGLANRRRFEEHLEKELVLAQRYTYRLAVLFLDLDRFKNINDTLGHHIGDLLLKEVAERIKKALRTSDGAYRGGAQDGAAARKGDDDFALVSRRYKGDSRIASVARMGGDEFTLMLTHLNHAEDAARVAQRIVDSLALPFNFDGEEVFISTSIGIALFPLDGGDAQSLRKNADSAMYYAKEEGGNNYQFFQQALKKEASARLSLESDLRKALPQDQFVLHYQPQIDIVTRKIFGVEALIRWQHPRLGLVPPLEFIPLAEETGLIVGISEWVLHKACEQVRAWHQAGVGDVVVAVNIASPVFRRLNLTSVISSALKASGLDAKYLELEVTESIMMQQLDNVLQTLRKLKDMNIKLSLDDFGTGYSSLSYLQKFPIDTLKIDRSFVSNIDKPEGSAIVLAIIAMARALNLQVIAEGVETPSQEQFLLAAGCAAMQGYLFSRPLPADALMQLLQRQAS